MSCPTCNSATMQKINDAAPPTFWCSRCGTLRTPHPAFNHDSVPSLIPLVRDLVIFKTVPPATDVWVWRAIREALGFTDP